MLHFEFKLWYKWIEWVTRANNSKAVSCYIPLVTANYLLSLRYAVAKWAEKRWSGEFCERVWSVSSDTQGFCVTDFIDDWRKNQC
jgi:hypothetical protein